ncbi:MAG: DUF2214 family protein [Cyclobacteriaceae bacterium]|nr:DUF2214 family protein [Cyclobacteriaceae bacterium]
MLTDFTAFILVKYLHLVSVFGMIGCLTGELVLLKPSMTRKELRNLSRLDGLYGLAAILAVAGGLTLWFAVGKGSDFYSHTFMHIKLTIVIIVGLVSIIPTLFYIRKSKGDPNESIETPSRIKKLVVLQLVLMAVVPPLATMVSYGIRIGN